MRWIAYVLGVLAIGFLQFILFIIFVPDSCAYHTQSNERPFLIKYCYEGVHPTPNVLNIVLTIVIGLALGHFIAKRIQ